MTTKIESGSEMTGAYRHVADFYVGKSVLITGSSGYLGTILLEVLLRCCPGIRWIFLLLRDKKGLSANVRKDVILQKKIFNSIKEKSPDVLNKIRVLKGDVTHLDLGIQPDDLRHVIEDVSVVFHCAAVISFTKPLKFMLLQNVVATDNVIELCRKLKKLDALIYTSTAFSNCYILDKPIEEKIYKLPISAKNLVDKIRKEISDENLMHLSRNWSSKFPNVYTLSKCLAENLLLEKMSDIPLSIIRPSVIISCWKGPLPGYVEEGSGLVDLAIGIGKGFVRVVNCDPTKRLHNIPVDVVANTHVVAPWSLATNKFSSPLVVNCTLSDKVLTWGKYSQILMKLAEDHPLPKSYQKASVVLRKNIVAYWISAILEHYAPAYVIDFLLLATNKKPRLVRLYKFYDMIMSSTKHFLFREWDFELGNFQNLAKALPEDDAQKLYVDTQECKFEDIFSVLPTGAPFYQWDIDRKSRKERMRTIFYRDHFTTMIKYLLIGWICMMVSLLVAKLA